MTDHSQQETFSAQIRKTIISTADYCSGKVHWGSSLSCVEILNALCTFLLQSPNINTVQDINERIIVSKGHAALALYAVLFEHGFIEDFRTDYQKDGSCFPEELTADTFLGISCSTGSLGLALPYVAGKALKSKLNNEDKKFYVIMGDGECDEGSVWESVMFSGHNKLDNLCVIIDRNHLQADGNTEEIVTLNALEANFRSFGWNAVTVCGHSYSELTDAVSTSVKDKPTVIIANTTKGKGISFMENDFAWHDRPLNREFLEQAKQEVGLCLK